MIAVNKIQRPFWMDEFARVCLEMIYTSEHERKFGLASRIVKDNILPCPNCQNPTIYYGISLWFDSESADHGPSPATYCPKCHDIRTIEYPWKPGRQIKGYLPTLKRKLIEHPQYRFLPTIEQLVQPCPLCNGPVFQLRISLGLFEHQCRLWHVCINPECHWLGECSDE